MANVTLVERMSSPFRPAPPILAVVQESIMTDNGVVAESPAPKRKGRKVAEKFCITCNGLIAEGQGFTGKSKKTRKHLEGECKRSLTEVFADVDLSPRHHAVWDGVGPIIPGVHGTNCPGAMGEPGDQGLPGVDYVDTAAFDPGPPMVVMNGDEFNLMRQRGSECVADASDGRPILECLYLTFGDGLEVQSADGFMLLVQNFDVTGNAAEGNIAVKAEEFTAIAKTFPATAKKRKDVVVNLEIVTTYSVAEDVKQFLKVSVLIPGHDVVTYSIAETPGTYPDTMMLFKSTINKRGEGNDRRVALHSNILMAIAKIADYTSRYNAGSLQATQFYYGNVDEAVAFKGHKSEAPSYYGLAMPVFIQW